MSLVSSISHHAEVRIPPVGGQSALIDRTSDRVHRVAAAALLSAALLVAALMMQAVTPTVHVNDNGPLSTVGVVNCDTVGNCLTP
jgi:hypothetical protein